MMQMESLTWLWTVALLVVAFVAKNYKGTKGIRINVSDFTTEKKITCDEQSCVLTSDKSALSNTSTIRIQPQATQTSAIQPIHTSAGENINTRAYYVPRFLQFQFHKKKLVLDLDETLISSSSRHSPRHDISVNVSINGSPATFYVRKRPHVDQFLEAMAEMFELVVFTASLSVYANAVIDKLDPKRLINRRYYRQSCLPKSGSYIKDLQIVCRDLSKVVIIDNSPAAYSYNRENGIPIDDYIGLNSQDQSLLRLIPLLQEVHKSEDVRHALKAHSHMMQMGGRRMSR